MFCLLCPSPEALNLLRRKRQLDRSHVSLVWVVNAMAIQFQDNKPSLSLDPRMQSVALGHGAHNGWLCSATIIQHSRKAKGTIPCVMSDAPCLPKAVKRRLGDLHTVHFNGKPTD